MLLAVSGGPDSMVMAHLALNCPYLAKVGVAHCNFSLRGADSDADEALVRSWAKSNSVPFHSIRFDTLKFARDNSMSVEMAARELRYEWFGKLVREHGYDFIAVAHNLNDDAETFFLNLMRGTGVKGLCGMTSRGEWILRPMLIFSREQIESFASAFGVPFRIDKTNFESEYKRNRIRNEIFPHLHKINPSFLHTMQRNMRYIAEVSDMAEATVAHVRKSVGVTAMGAAVVDPSGWKIPGYSLFRIMEDFSFNSAVAEDMLECLTQRPLSGKRFVSSTHLALIDRGRILVYPIEAVPHEMGGTLEIGQTLLEGPRERFVFGRDAYSVTVTDAAHVDFAEGLLFLDCSKISWPVRVRQWARSDRMRPFGMKSGSRKLSDIFSDAKLDLVSKSLTPVFEDAEGKIIALGTCVISDFCRITAQTDKALRIAKLPG